MLITRKIIPVQLGYMITQLVYAAPPVEEIATLPTVVVTADHPYQTQDPYSVATTTSLTHEEVIQSGKRDISNVLQGQPGVSSGFVNRGYPAQLSIRGSIGSLGMVTVDDIPLIGLSSNLMSLAPFAAEALEGVDIVRGPSAYRYGNTALGGVIRLSTRDSQENNAYARLEGGSFDTLSETIGASLTGTKGRANISVSRDDLFTGTNISDSALGNREKDSFHSTMAIGRYHLNPTTNLQLDGTLLYNAIRANADSYTFSPFNWLGVTDNPNTFAQGDGWLAQQTATLTLSSHWNSSLKLGLSQHSGDALLGLSLQPNSTFYLPLQFTSRLLLANWRNQHNYVFGADKLSVQWGGDIREETGEGDEASDPINKHRTTVAGFADADITLGQWNASAGVRVNHYNDLGVRPNYYLGLAWQALPQLKLRGTAGVGYRPPAINELWEPVLGNPNLKPERAVSGELGVDWTPTDTLSVALTGFYSRYRNMIACLPERDTMAAVNANSVRIQGLEMQYRYKPWQTLAVGTDYSYTDSYNADKDQAYSSSSHLIEIPEHSARFFGDWQASLLPIALHLEGIYTSGWHFDRALTSTSVGVNDSFRLNAQLSYNIQQNTQLYVRGENLNNDRTPLNVTYGFPGVAVYGGIKLALF